MKKIAETNNVPKITAEVIGLMAANYERGIYLLYMKKYPIIVLTQLN